MDLFEHAARKGAGADATATAAATHITVERRAAGMAWVRGCTGTLAQVMLREGQVLCPGCHEWLDVGGDGASG